MRFLMLNWRDPANPKAGGAERVTLGFLNALAERGHEVCWFAFEFPGAPAEDRCGPIRVIRSGGAGGAVLAARQWFFRQKRFDLVIDQHHGIPWYAPWWSRTRCIAYIHEVLGPIWRSFYRWPTSAIGEFQERWTHRLYRNVPFWTVCESTRRCLEQNGARHVKVLPNGLDTVPLAKLDPKPLASPLRLAAVSRLAPNKRVDHAIRAVRVLKDRSLPARLSIVGAGEDEPRLRMLTEHLGLQGEVSFAGRLSESAKDEVLRQAHFLLHASVREGWGLNVLEANAMGTPALVYPVPGLIDSTLDGRTGWVARAETPEALADLVPRVLQAPGQYEALREAAWRRSFEFQWSRVLPPACEWLEAQARGGAQVP